MWHRARGHPADRQGDGSARRRREACGCRGRRPCERSSRSRSTAAPSGAAAPLLLNPALQGGGAHGAVTWGVLDRRLEDERIAFEGVSGTSAGAINAVLLVSGWLADGRAGARRALDAFWGRLAAAISLLPALGLLTRPSLEPTARARPFSVAPHLPRSPQEPAPIRPSPAGQQRSAHGERRAGERRTEGASGRCARTGERVWTDSEG